MTASFGPGTPRDLEAVRHEPDPHKRLTELARSTLDDRMWAVWAAPRILGAGSAAILSELARDRDADVRTEAISELARVDLEAARRLAPRIRQSLQSPDLWEPVSAMWTLLSLGDPDAIRAIAAASSTWREPFRRRIAEIVVQGLSGNSEAIYAAMDAHDHIAMPWLAHAIRLMHTPQARQALERCAAGGLDPECRGHCERELAEW
jgi:hypothetical protein